MRGTLRHLTISSPAYYEVSVLGSLDENWSSRIGMRIKVSKGVNNTSITTLTGEVIDQSMLLGVLNYVYELGMPIIMVRCVKTDS